MDLNQNPETEELENIKSRLITDFTYSTIILLAFFIIALILKYFFHIPLYNEIYFLILGWFTCNYLNLYVLKKRRISLKTIRKIDFFHHIAALLFVTVIFYYTGSILWIGAIFYIFIILFASILSPPKESLIITLIAFVFYSLTVLLIYLDIIPYKEFFIFAPSFYQNSQYVITTTLVMAVVFFSIFFSGKNFAQRLKQRNTELAQVKKELEEWSNKLEEEVRLRTLELKKVNEDLKQDITKRKQAEREIKQGYKKLQRTMEGTINIMAKIVETRDPYTAGHQQRVSKLATSIAQEMILSQDKIEGIRITALIHDIGKISIPAEILSKPSKLNEMEFGLIKNHSKIGYDILRKIDFPWPLAKIILQHHERLDGSGYPQGLKGDEILMEARILGVADVVEAMSSHRPYRPALGIDKALEEISKNKGIFYDPKVVDMCIKLFKEKGFKFE